MESGYDITDEQFNQLAALMQNENEVIEAYEMAKDGTGNQIYPLEGNEAAMGLDMLEKSGSVEWRPDWPGTAKSTRLQDLLS